MTTTNGADIPVAVEFVWVLDDLLEPIDGWDLWTSTP